jgi:hypothetical protein
MIVRSALVIVVMALAGPGVLHAQPVAEVEQIQFYSSFWVNLHMTLYAQAVTSLPNPAAMRLGAQPSGPLPGELSDPERTAWNTAVDYYKANLARRDLRTGQNMTAIQQALVDSVNSSDDGLIESSSLTADHRRHLLASAPVYRRHWWAEHDRAIRAWIADIASKIRDVGPRARQRQAALLETEWFRAPVRAEITFFGRAYTTVRPTLTTLAVGDPNYAGWAGAEMMFHEVSHALTEPMDDRIRREASALGKAVPGDLGHVCMFYITGEVWRSELATRGIVYVPYMYGVGLFDRVWNRLQAPLETHIKPYVEGRIDAQTAFRRLIEAVPQ